MTVRDRFSDKVFMSKVRALDEVLTRLIATKRSVKYYHDNGKKQECLAVTPRGENE